VKRHYLNLIVGVMVGVITTGLAQAQTASPDIIITRQAGFDLQQGAFDSIEAAVKANVDVKPYASAAGGIVSWAKQIPLAFPKGSETGHDTKAKPEIWSDSAGFAKDANALTAAAEKLEMLAKADDASGVADQLKVVDRACVACHRGYRVRSGN